MEIEQVQKKLKTVITLPTNYTDCSAEHLITLLVDMFSNLIRHNDNIPITMANTTRFHSRSAPAIQIKEYVERINKYVIVEKSVLIMALIFVDRMCTLYPTFTISSLTAHRFLIASITASCKCVSDVYSTNAFFAKVGGISTAELNEIELEFCKLLQWRLMCSSAILQEYYCNLILSNPRFVREGFVEKLKVPVTPKSPIDGYLDHS